MEPYSYPSSYRRLRFFVLTRCSTSGRLDQNRCGDADHACGAQSGRISRRPTTRGSARPTARAVSCAAAAPRRPLRQQPCARRGIGSARDALPSRAAARRRATAPYFSRAKEMAAASLARQLHNFSNPGGASQQPQLTPPPPSRVRLLYRVAARRGKPYGEAGILRAHAALATGEVPPRSRPRRCASSHGHPSSTPSPSTHPSTHPLPPSSPPTIRTTPITLRPRLPNPITPHSIPLLCRRTCLWRVSHHGWSRAARRRRAAAGRVSAA